MTARTAEQIAADLTANNPLVASAMAPLSVPCPWCKSARGQRCSTGRYAVSIGIHAQRRAKVAHLTEAEKIAAYAEVLAEEGARRAQVVAHMAGVR